MQGGNSGRRDYGRRAWRRLLVAVLAALVVLIVPVGARASTVVSIEFDDGTADQLAAKPVLAAHGMHATFYVNSGTIGGAQSQPWTTMTWEQVRSLRDDGHEIGGHTVSHRQLPSVEADEQRREICNDRLTLTNQGFSVTDFAYPYGSWTPETQQIARECGYNSGRDVSGVRSPGSCVGCPFAEAVPPPAPFATRTPEHPTADTTLTTLKQYVTQAEQNGGGWVQVVFHHLCAACGQTYSTPPQVFSDFVDWLAPRTATGTQVKTVHEVIGGSVKPVFAGPAPPSHPDGLNWLRNSSLEQDDNGDGVPDCWQENGYGQQTYTWTPTADAHTGSRAMRVDTSNHTSGVRNLIVFLDLGSCSPSVAPGERYRISTWFKSTVAVPFVLYTRDAVGGWSYWTTSPAYGPANAWTEAAWTTPPVPGGATAVSFGMTLMTAGSLTTDDYSFRHQASTTDPAPLVPAAPVPQALTSPSVPAGVTRNSAAAAIPSQTLSVSRSGQLSALIDCRAASRCIGRLTVTALGPASRTGNRQPNFDLGTAAFSIAANRRGTVRIRLSRSARRRLRKLKNRRYLRASLTVKSASVSATTRVVRLVVNRGLS